MLEWSIMHPDGRIAYGVAYWDYRVIPPSLTYSDLYREWMDQGAKHILPGGPINMRSVELKFLPKDRVIIDGDPDLVAIITNVNLRPDGAPTYCIEWFDAGTAKELWVNEFRISLAKD